MYGICIGRKRTPNEQSLNKSTKKKDQMSYLPLGNETLQHTGNQRLTKTGYPFGH